MTEVEKLDKRCVDNSARVDNVASLYGPPTAPWYENRKFGEFKCHFPDGSSRAIPFKCVYPSGFSFRHKWIPEDMNSFIFAQNGIGEWFAFPETDKDELQKNFTDVLIKYFK